MKIIDTMPKTPFYSLEFFPPPGDSGNMDSFFQVAEKLRALDPLYVSITYGAGGSTQQNTLEVSARLAEMGFKVMPHLTCVGASQDSLCRFLGQLRDRKVDNVMALRGDRPQGQSDYRNEEFPHASDLVTFIRRVYPDCGIAVAGYPTPHPESATFAEDRLHTKNKMDAGADFIITQVFFDAREYFAMVEHLRALGVTKPVIPGIMPILSLDSLRRILSLCGASIPGSLYLSLEAAFQQGGNKAVREMGLNFAARQIRCLRQGGAPGIHLYTLNQAAMCLRIAQEAGGL